MSANWIAGYEGTILGWGPTRDDAVADALEFLDRDIDAEQRATLDVLRTSHWLRLGIETRPGVTEYVIRDGRADVP